MDNKNEIHIMSFFNNPVLSVALDLDINKLTELTLQIQSNDTKGTTQTNRGGWQSQNIFTEGRPENLHPEFKKLKKEIHEYLQMYHDEVFNGMKFKGDITHKVINMWLNINEKHNYNEPHIHLGCTLSGVFYIKHDGSSEHGNITFKHPRVPYLQQSHWPVGMVENYNTVTTELIHYTPSENKLLIFPAWLEHKVDSNLKDDTRISLSFNSIPIMEKKS